MDGVAAGRLKWLDSIEKLNPFGQISWHRGRGVSRPAFRYQAPGGKGHHESDGIRISRLIICRLCIATDPSSQLPNQRTMVSMYIRLPNHRPYLVSSCSSLPSLVSHWFGSRSRHERRPVGLEGDHANHRTDAERPQMHISSSPCHISILVRGRPSSRCTWSTSPSHTDPPHPRVACSPPETNQYSVKASFLPTVLFF